MESDHKSNDKNGTPVNRNGTRGVRPRLADLLESVTVPDESAATLSHTNGANNGEPNDNNLSSSTSFNSTSAPSTSLRSETARFSGDNSATSDLTAANLTTANLTTATEPSTFNTAAFDDDSLEESLSPVALAAKKRREALYSQREDESTSVHKGYSGRGKSEVTSLANRLFGERQVSEKRTDETPLDSVSNGLSEDSFLPKSPSFRSSNYETNSYNSDDDWTRKFSADAPLPNTADSPTSTSIDHEFESGRSELSKSELGKSETNEPATNGYGFATEHLSGKNREDFSYLDKPLTERFRAEQSDLGSSRSESSDSEQHYLSRSRSHRTQSDESILSSRISSSPISSRSISKNEKRSNRDGRREQNPVDPQPTSRRYSTTGPSPTELLNSVSIKGRSDGVSIEVGQGKWSDILEALSQRLVQSTGFFRGGKVTLDIGTRPLQESELQEVSALTEQHGLSLTSVRSQSEQSCQVALAAGLAASLDAADGLLAQPALSNYEKLEHFVYRGNLRSGQILRRSETILVMGDVNPGSQIISDSDILIWGRLRGIAHAGASGDQNAVIAALLMEPTQIRISDAIAILPEQETKTSITERLSGGNASPNGVKRPEIAHAIGADIIVDMWDESKPGGIMAFRRSL